MMLAIEVAFLTGRYIATAYNSRVDSEWPPHPARLFSALVATHFAADPSVTPDYQGERQILEWLERLTAPSVVASDAAPRDVVTVFVPVNDVALTDVDEEASELDDARAALSDAEATGDAKAIRRRAADVKKAESTLKKAVLRATEVPSKAVAPKYGTRVLPDHRIRQPRTFPSVTPDVPRVTFVWPDATPTDSQRAQLDALLRRVVRLGHSSSFVSTRLVDEHGIPRWLPADDGEETLRGVEPGQFAALEQAFERHREIEPRVMPSVPHTYTQGSLAAPEVVPESIFSDDWLVLRRVGGSHIPITATAGIARAVRRTLMSYADEPIPEVLSGHAANGGASLQPHLAIVPLPFVAHEQASGAILGVGLVLPRAVGAADRSAVYRSVALWEEAYRLEDEDTPSVKLNLGASGELRLERIEWGAAQMSLRPATWYGPARVWYSVTPVALDRHPGDLRSREASKLNAAIAEAIGSIVQACERIGLRVRPKYVEILPNAPWVGAAKARNYPPYPGDTTRTQRVLTHVRIEFDRPVKGPILLGAGRFLGLGLFRPEGSR